ncbi:class I tRNA ligase family protein [Candidatus Peregrinibacteria bacterium]|nr:class I tRNA ligase family protein [Candidatus Peregrinibacteria bacterium]
MTHHQKPFAAVDAKVSLPKTEHEVLDFWDREKIFEKSVRNRKGLPKYIFFDGPPFANGLPHYGHILAGALKDAVTRYWTMRGFYVPRVNGWDCHGLPVEYEMEKELKLAGRKDIEKMGVAKFNAACRHSVFRYTEEWEKLIRRIGRFVDFEHSYATLDNNYMESIWWVFSQIWKKKLIYQKHRSMHTCPRCETPLSNFEVTLGYKDVTDLSIIAKFRSEKDPSAYFLAWTTTPWTLPGNMALAVGADVTYVRVKRGEESFILAKDLLRKNFASLDGIVVEAEMKGKKLVGERYTPLFPYYQNTKLTGIEKAWRVIATDFVTTEDGTGIVHIAPGYGEDDYIAAVNEGIPVIQHVNMAGIFEKEVADFSGKFVKGQEHHIADWLEQRSLLFGKENYRHSYPHCWRCDTPLLNFAAKGWFIRVTDVKKKLLKNNRKIHWVPEHIKEGRFGKWLDGARDWNISRNRFWGCPIPVWECPRGTQKCIGSLKELRENSLGGNTFFIVRHGEARQNVEDKLNSDPLQDFHLTEEGRRQAGKASRKLAEQKIDMIFCSQLPRARETAEIFSAALGVSVTADNRLREREMGIFDGKSPHEYIRTFADLEDRYSRRVEGGESFEDMESRAIEFINYLNKKHEGKNIVIVTHGDVVRAVARYFDRLSVEETFTFKPGLAEIYVYRAGKLPLRDGKLDIHKPFIDDIELRCDCCAQAMKRIPEVLDCWFESGAMPYAQLHYPFENKKEFEKNFPAHFIAEGLDQTRGWFYTLHVLAAILFNKPAFQNVIVNGILLAADGEKLSKRKKNYPDPNALFETHGVDSTRMFLYSSTAPYGEDVRFSEKHVEEVVKQFSLPLWNAYSFFVTYANIDGWRPNVTDDALKEPPRNKLDAWILSELHVLIQEVTEQMDGYNLTRATRPLLSFVDKLSNWYIRRSRRRFWKSENDEDKNDAYKTLYGVLVNFSRLLAPFMPMLAEAIFRNLTGKESVHLEEWPTLKTSLIDTDLNEETTIIRTLVSLALRIRAKKSIKVRQPLQKLLLALPKHTSKDLVMSYRDIILDELNVKEICFESEGEMAAATITVDSRKVGPRFGAETQKIINLAKAGDFSIQSDGSVALPKTGKASYILRPEEVSVGYCGKEGFDVESENGILVALDTNVTETLREEGCARDIIRHIQELRKKTGYGIADRIYVFIAGTARIQKAATHFADIIARETLAIEIQEGGGFEWDAHETVHIDGEEASVGVRKK